MKNNEVLFCREAVVIGFSETTAYNILQSSNAIKDKSGFFKALFFCVCGYQSYRNYTAKDPFFF